MHRGAGESFLAMVVILFMQLATGACEGPAAVSIEFARGDAQR